MKHPLVTLALVTILSAATAHAVDIFADQPKIKAAFNKLNGALASVERSRLGEPQKHLNDAIVNLSMAKNSLEQAAKDKGSYRTAAIRLIDQAKQELQATPSDPKHIDTATNCIKEALDKVTKAGKTGGR